MWLFDKIYSATPGATITDIIFDGAYIAVTSGKTVKFFSWWDCVGGYEDRNNEPRLVPAGTITMAPVFTWDLSSVATNNLFNLAKEGNNLFVSDGSTYSTIFKLDLSNRLNGETKTTVDGTYNLPVPSNALFEVANDKIWFTDLATTDQINPERQRLYTLNINTLVVNSVEIPTRKQFEPVNIVYGYDDYIWIVNYNNVSCMKFNVNTGAWVNTVRTAKGGNTLFVNQDKTIFVGSTNGLVQNINQTTDVVTSLLGTGIVIPVTDANPDPPPPPLSIGLVDDGTYVWSANEDFSLSRVDKTTRDARFTTGSGGFKIGSSTVVYPFETNTQRITITPPFSYQYWNGSGFETRNVRSYIFITSNNAIYGWRRQAMYRENSFQVRGTAMIATGSEKYYGENP